MITTNNLLMDILGIYPPDSETTASIAGIVTKPQRPSLSETVLSLESFEAKQMALSYILNAMSILQARSAISYSLTCHSNINNSEVSLERPISPVSEGNSENLKMEAQNTTIQNDVVTQGGGEGPADVTALLVNFVQNYT